MSSQHPYAEQYVGRPHVMTVDYNNSLEFETAVREIMRTKVRPEIFGKTNKVSNSDCIKKTKKKNNKY